MIKRSVIAKYTNELGTITSQSSKVLIRTLRTYILGKGFKWKLLFNKPIKVVVERNFLT